MSKKQGPICISVINMKGGVGKTTIAALLGRYASITLNLKVLAVDLDPQANLSQAFMRERYRNFLDDRMPSIVELFKGHNPPSQLNPSPSPVDIEQIVVKGTPLGGNNLRLIPSRFEFSDNLVNSLKPDTGILAHTIAQQFQDCDIVIIDCAPTESILTRAAYLASRYVLVPVKPEFFATIGFPLLADSIGNFKRSNVNHALDVAGIVINNATYHYGHDRGGPERLRSIIDIEKDAIENGWPILENQIPFSRGFPKIMRGDLSHSGDAGQFHFFAQEFFSRIIPDL